jgi:acyl dehydratase
LHIDAEFAGKSQHGRVLVNSLYTLGLVIGISVSETTLGTTIGNLGMENVEFPHPVFIGDTLRVTTVIKDKLASKSKPDRGVVWFEHSAYNQRGELVCQCLRKGMMIRDSHLNTTN